MKYDSTPGRKYLALPPAIPFPQVWNGRHYIWTVQVSKDFFRLFIWQGRSWKASSLFKPWVR